MLVESTLLFCWRTGWTILIPGRSLSGMAETRGWVLGTFRGAWALCTFFSVGEIVMTTGTSSSLSVPAGKRWVIPLPPSWRYYWAPPSHVKFLKKKSLLRQPLVSQCSHLWILPICRTCPVVRPGLSAMDLPSELVLVVLCHHCCYYAFPWK